MRDLAAEHAIYQAALEDIVSWDSTSESLSPGWRGYCRGVQQAQIRAARALREAREQEAR